LDARDLFRSFLDFAEPRLVYPSGANPNAASIAYHSSCDRTYPVPSERELQLESHDALYLFLNFSSNFCRGIHRRIEIRSDPKGKIQETVVIEVATIVEGKTFL
jgi:hypothetical protein